VIASIRCRETQRVFDGERSRRLPNQLLETMQRKLRMLDAATVLDDLRNPPGNRLEKLKGERAGQHSIRVNSQWRVCFRWRNGQAHDVEIVDYH
jgi:proteic killer suppression protein